MKDLRVDMAPRSFRLELDFKMVAVDYASGIQFYLFDSDKNSQEHHSYVWATFTNEDRGHIVLMSSAGADNQQYYY